MSTKTTKAQMAERIAQLEGERDAAKKNFANLKEYEKGKKQDKDAAARRKVVRVARKDAYDQGRRDAMTDLIGIVTSDKTPDTYFFEDLEGSSTSDTESGFAY